MVYIGFDGPFSNPPLLRFILKTNGPKWAEKRLQELKEEDPEGYEEFLKYQKKAEEWEAYDDDVFVLVEYENSSLEDRKKLTEKLISEDKKIFKKFIGILQEFYEDKLTDESPQDLLRIDIDKFLNEDIIEYF